MHGVTYMNRIRCSFILIIGIGASLSASSQISIRFPTDTVEVRAGTTGMIYTRLMNTGIRLEKFLPVFSVNEIQLLNKPSENVQLLPTDERVIPIRFFVPRRIKADTMYQLDLRLQMNEPVLDGLRKSIFIKVTKVHEMRVELMQGQLYSNHPDGVISFQMKCRNLGNSAEPVFFQIHNEYGVESASEKVSGLMIPAFSDTTLNIIYKLPSPLNQKKLLQLHIIGKYQRGGQTFSSHLLKVNNLRPKPDNTQINEPNRVVSSNTIALFARNVTNNDPYYELMADFKHYIGQTEMHYHINGFYYSRYGSLTQVALLNTYVELNRERLGLRIGQISKNLEIPLYGRGASFRLGSYEKSYLEAGFVNSDNNLLAQFRNNSFEASNSVYAKGVQKFGGSFGLKYNFLGISDPYNQANSLIAGLGNEWKLGGKHAFQWAVYKSSTNNDQYSTVRKNAEGMAGEFSYSGQLGKISLSTSNYYSTSAYAGFLKGALNLDERISYAAGRKLVIWARYNQYKNQPDFFSPYSSLLNFSSLIQTTETGVNLKEKQADFSFRPSLYHEYSDYYKTFLQIGPITLTSKRFALTGNFQLRRNQFISINGDVGYSESNVAGSEKYVNFRASLLYQNTHIMLNASYQDGAYYAAELAGVQLNSRKYAQMNAGLTLKDIRLTKKMLLTLGNHLSYNNMFQLWSNNSFANASYNMGPNLALVLGYSRFQNSYNSLYRNTHSKLDVGVIKKLKVPGRPQKQKNVAVEMLVYVDLNGNRHYDAGEPVSANTMVLLNEMSMITDMAGKVVFPKIPSGNYSMSVIRQDGYISENRTLYISTSTSLQVPLYKIGILSGTVKIQKEALSYETDEHVSNIRILAIDGNGTMYSALTDEKGQYFFYLPDNTYDIQIDVTSVPELYEVINIQDKIRVTQQAGNTMYQFYLRIKKRPVEVKKIIPKISGRTN